MVDAAHEEENLRRTSGHTGLMQHIVVIGKTGQLARALIARADAHNIKITAFGRSDCDLSADAETLRAFAGSLPECDGLIIAAAYTAVDHAEDDTDTALQVNGVAPGVFAKECAARNIPLVHISTDYVFPGDGETPLKPSDPTGPGNAYGASKLAGEKAIQASDVRAAILRTSWVYDGTEPSKNFMKTMLGFARKYDQLTVVADQVGRPTNADDLADASLAAIGKMMHEPDFKGGIYHVSNTGIPVSWAGFARSIMALYAKKTGKHVSVKNINSDEAFEMFKQKARRPSYSVLDTTSFETEFDHKLPEWKTGLANAFIAWESWQ